MVRYEYRVDEEDFKRIDNRGRPIKINITEARQIESLLNLGYSITKIYDKVDFYEDVSITTLRTFVRNLKEGDIDLEGDYPAPVYIKKDIDLEARVFKLEQDIGKFESMLNELSEKLTEDNKESETVKKVRTWLRI